MAGPLTALGYGAIGLTQAGAAATTSYVIGHGAKTYLRQGCQWGPKGIKTVIHQLVVQAKTDSDPNITYDPEHRPEVANLVHLTALCEGLDPLELADEVGSRGASELKRRAAEAVNEHLKPIRSRRAELMRDRGYLRDILRHGSDRARGIAQRTLEAVAAAMHTDY